MSLLLRVLEGRGGVVVSASSWLHWFCAQPLHTLIAPVTVSASLNSVA